MTRALRPVSPPPTVVWEEAKARLGALATPTGALGRLGELGAWLAAAQGAVPPRPIDHVRAVIFAGEDALTRAEAEQAISAGITVAGEETAAGAQLLISGDMGIGNTTPAAALIAHTYGLPAFEVTGRGTGIDDAGFALKTVLIQRGLDRVASSKLDAIDVLAALGSPDIAASAGYMAAAAAAGVPVLLDGLISVAAAVMADRLAPGASAWFIAAHRSTEPAQSIALDKLGLTTLLDLSMQLGEGSGAIAAGPLVRSAALLLREVALLSDLA